MGTIEAICTSAKRGERKRPVPAAAFVAGLGILSDAHAGDPKRQVSILAAEDIEEVRQKGLPDLAPGDFAENLVLSGLDLHRLGPGSRIRLGSAVVLEVTQVGKDCHAPCRIARLTGDCIMPRKGLFARVEAGGEVRPGDPAEVLG